MAKRPVKKLTVTLSKHSDWDPAPYISRDGKSIVLPSSDLSKATGIPVTDVSDPIEALIASKVATPAFTPAQTDAIRRVLEANDAEPNRQKRVSVEAMCQTLRDHFGWTKQRWTFDRHLRKTFGRGWSK